MRLLAALVITIITVGTVMADSIDSAAEHNRALVRASFDAWRNGSGSPFELLADDARWTITGNSAVAGTYPGKEAFLAAVIRPFNARMQIGLKPTLRGLYADGDMVIVHFDASGTARDGEIYANNYAWFLELRGDRIVTAVAFFDSVAFDALWARVTPQ